MSQWIGNTNRKLYQCRLLLDQLRSGSSQPALQQALEESALYQVRDAWIAYLHELADTVALRQPVDSLEALLAAAPLLTGEMQELRQLAADPFSWLSQMLNAAQQQQLPQLRAAAVQQHAEAETQRIGLLAVADEQAQTEFWWQQLSRLIDAQRSNRLEV